MSKLDELVEREGYESVDDLLQAVVADAVCPAICTNISCHYTQELEPDQDRGWCPECGMNSMKSALVLAGLI
jgi:hypothetical protein